MVDERLFDEWLDGIYDPRNVLRGKLAKLMDYLDISGYKRDLAFSEFEKWIRTHGEIEAGMVLRMLRE